MVFLIGLIIFLGLCVYYGNEKKLPKDYHRNWKLEAEDAAKVSRGEMSRREFNKNMENGKYR